MSAAGIATAVDCNAPEAEWGETAMMTLPPIPSWDTLHPLIIHFPIALLLVAPMFIFLGIFVRPPGRTFSVAALVLLVLGTTAAFVAVETGEAAGELVVRTPEISRVLEHHAELADKTVKAFLALTLIFASILLLPRMLRKEVAPRVERSLQAIFLIMYMAGLVVLVNTAHQGGTLVHGLGVRAI